MHLSIFCEKILQFIFFQQLGNRILAILTVFVSCGIM
nr:MAG TPA: hypothetical protein [Caudoviricetes sp.]